MKETPDTTGIEEIKKAFREQSSPLLEITLNKIIYQKLQKARHDWLREEIVKLEGMKQTNVDHTIHCIKGLAENHEHCIRNLTNTEKRYNQALQTIIDRYQSELDQDLTTNK